MGVEIARIANQKKLQMLLQEGILYEREGRVYAKDYFLGDEIVLFLARS